jgi:tetratricopeptide (TPR) repeat protein
MFRMSTRQLEEAKAALEGALAIFREIGDLGGEARALDTLGLTYDHLNQPEKALEYLNGAVDLSRKAGLRSSEGVSRANRASTLLTLSRFVEAREDLDAALETANRPHDDHLRGLALGKLAVLKVHEEENSTRAMEMLEEALEAFHQAGDRIHELVILTGIENAIRSFLGRPAENRSYAETSAALRKLATIHTARHEHREARGVYGELLHEAERVDDLSDRLEALIQLGRCSVLLKEHQQAARDHQEALVVLEALRRAEGLEAYRVAEYELWLSLGQAQRHLRRPEEARASYERARDIAQELGDDEAKWRAEANLGLIYTDLGQFDQAIRTLERSTEFYRKSRNRRLEAHGLFNQAYAYHRKGDSAKARQIGEESCRLLEQMGHPSAEEVRQQMKTWLPREARERSIWGWCYQRLRLLGIRGSRCGRRKKTIQS